MKRLAIGVISVMVIGGCGGSGTSVGSTFGVFRQLSSPFSYAAKPLAVSDTGDIVSSAGTGIETDPGYAWTGTSPHRLTMSISNFTTISPNGTWVCTTQALGPNSNRHPDLRTFNRLNGQTAIVTSFNPSEPEYISDATVSDDGSVRGSCHLNGQWCHYTWTGTGPLIIIPGWEFSTVMLQWPTGATYQAPVAFSENRKFACGEVDSTVNGKTVRQSIVWDLTNQKYELTGTPDIPGEPYSFFRATRVSNDGKTVLGTVIEQPVENFVGTSVAGIWRQGTKPQETLSLMHANNFGQGYDIVDYQ